MDIFPSLEPSLSPRLIWMREHGIETHHDPSFDKAKPWTAFMWKDGWGGIAYRVTEKGDTEDAALTALALAAGIKLWNE